MLVGTEVRRVITKAAVEVGLLGSGGLGLASDGRGKGSMSRFFWGEVGLAPRSSRSPERRAPRPPSPPRALARSCTASASGSASTPSSSSRATLRACTPGIKTCARPITMEGNLFS